MNTLRLASAILLMGSSLGFCGKVVNVYLWGDDIPKKIIHRFERESGVTVHLSSYDSSETMYTKLSASSNNTYDVVMPSGNYVQRMQRRGLLAKMDHRRLPNLKNLDAMFLHTNYDPGNQYSIPLTWGSSGIFYNETQIHHAPTKWTQLWRKAYTRRLLLLDDAREIFSMAMMGLGYSPNDTNPAHIDKAYKQLQKLIPNIKLFANDGLQAMLIDGDANIGVVWNSDAYKAHTENSAIRYIYPKEGFIIWIDNLAITSNAPHVKEAYEFINFMLKPSISAEIGATRGLAITNKRGKALLPPSVRNNITIYPTKKTLKRGHFQQDVGEETNTLYMNYWQALKLQF